MKNRDVFAKDPAQNRPLNNGVATVNDAFSEEEYRTLRFELESFVCDGQYEKGLERILDTFLSNQTQTSQPGVWVSGFFGSGKSHLVKVLRALWTDFTFPNDNATARGLVKVTTPVKDHLVGLERVSKKQGGLHACSGTLGFGVGGNVRMALLGIVFRSVGLSEQYPFACFEMWLKKEGYYESVRSAVEGAGKDWHRELTTLYVSPLLSKALLDVYPEFAKNAAEARSLLKENYPNVQDVTIDQMVDAIRDALTAKGKFPLTLIALDEVQQYIGEDQARTYAIQEVTEACCNRFGPKILFVGTGQTALSGTPNLQKLKGRFQIPVELSDNDVDEVIRKVILAKKSSALGEVKTALDRNAGEISRHLEGTKLGPSSEDGEFLVADYPILPVRRRFWERTLRAVDQGGTAGQLRSQLGIVHEAVTQIADAKVGVVVAGDFIYDQIAPKLLQAGVLPRETYEYTEKLRIGSASDKLKGRLCSLIFLIGKLPQDSAADLGVRATVNVLADLLVSDLDAGSTELRKQIPDLLKDLESDGKVMHVGQEWRTQTKESGAWNDEYRAQLGKMLGDPQRIEQQRLELVRAEGVERLGKIKVQHGKIKEQRKPSLVTGTERPKDMETGLNVWLRDGWVEEPKAVLAEVQAAGNHCPAVFVYVPRHANDDLRQSLASWRAAAATLKIKGVPSTPEGIEASRAMQSREVDEERRVRALVDEIFNGAVVYQAGGSEVVEDGGLAPSVQLAVENALVRLYPKFEEADHENWDKVIERARKGSEAALEAIGHKGDVGKHPVTKALLNLLVAGKAGADVRAHFEENGHGWAKDAIDGGLYALLAAGQIRATEPGGKAVDAKGLDRGKISQVTFRSETIPITGVERVQLRVLFQGVGIQCASGEELSAASRFLEKLRDLRDAAGGDAPQPERPSLTGVLELEKLAGNEQLSALFTQKGALLEQAKSWEQTAKKIADRGPAWQELQSLLQHGSDLAECATVQAEADAVQEGRLLLADPDPIPQLTEQVTQALRTALNNARNVYQTAYTTGMDRLKADDNWSKLSPEQRHALLIPGGLLKVPEVTTGTSHEVLTSLRSIPLGTWADRTAALPTRFQAVLRGAAELMEPAAVYYELPGGTLRSDAEIHSWIEALEKDLVDRLKRAGGVLVVH